MAMWMLASVVSAAVLGVVGVLAERALMILRRASRWLWFVLMVGSGVWPFIAGAILGARRSRFGGDVSSTTGSLGEAMPVWGSTDLGLLDAPLGAWLGGAWILASSLLLVVLWLSAETLKQDRRRWVECSITGERVFLSGWLGPAVVGVRHPRIVLPRWVLELDEGIQSLIVLHEREHVRAGDSRLLMGGLLILVLLPWCAPLWWQFRRLRLAIEMDCDERLLKSGTSGREYANALLTVAERRRRTMFPLTAMTLSGRTLRHRIRRIVSAPPSRSVPLVLTLLVVSGLASAGAAMVPIPPAPSLAALTIPSISEGSESPTVTPEPPGGTLPGDPGQERLAAELEAHHSAAIAAGLPDQSVIWFLVDQAGEISHTGIDQGTAREVEGRIRARYPGEASNFSLRWSDVPAPGGGEATVVWLLPPG